MTTSHPSGDPRDPATPTLSHERIVTAALALLDETGSDGFSMRKLGARLGVDPMAVYRYLETREDLFDAVAVRLFDEVEVESLPWENGWREPLETYCHRLRTVLLTHPRAVTVFATRPVRSADAIATGERMMHQLTAAGVPPGPALQLLRCVREFTVGHALTLAVVDLGAGERSRKPEPGSAEYNLLATGADSADIGDHFALGLSAMLDGFAVR